MFLVLYITSETSEYWKVLSVFLHIPNEHVCFFILSLLSFNFILHALVDSRFRSISAAPARILIKKRNVLNTLCISINWFYKNIHILKRIPTLKFRHLKKNYSYPNVLTNEKNYYVVYTFNHIAVFRQYMRFCIGIFNLFYLYLMCFFIKKTKKTIYYTQLRDTVSSY